MKGPPLVFLAFGALLLVHTGVMFAFTDSSAIMKLLLGGAGAASVLVGLAVAAWRVRSPDVLVLPELSMATTLLAFGLAAMVVGAELGAWLVLIGAGTSAIAAGGLVRERRARPR